MYPKHVLVVDDVYFQLELVKNQLLELGVADVSCVSEGHEAISILKNTQGPKPDLIITDVLMPPPDGRDLLRFISEHDISTPVVLMSSSTESLLRCVTEFARTSKVELVGTLTKPVRLSDLKSLLEQDGEGLSSSPVSVSEVVQKSALIVDDDPILFETAAAVLRQRGFTDIALAASVAAARQHLRSEAKVGLLILDLNMPDSDGVEFLSDLRQEWSDVPIVISSSAHASVRDAAFRLAKAYGLDVRGAVAKPFTLEKLDQVLR